MIDDFFLSHHLLDDEPCGLKLTTAHTLKKTVQFSYFSWLFEQSETFFVRQEVFSKFLQHFLLTIERQFQDHSGHFAGDQFKLSEGSQQKLRFFSPHWQI